MKTDLQRFENKIFYSPDGCWYWLGNIDVYGYGVIGPKNGRRIKAHRYSYQVYKGPIPDGLYILHRCDNTMCVNPDHLWAGTPSDNMIDMANKGRSNHGEKNPKSKLTEVQIRVIREAYELGHRQCNIRRYFKMTPGWISRIVGRKTWTRI